MSNLVITATTKKGSLCVENWLHGNYDSVVIYYDCKAYSEYALNGVHYICNEGFKYPMIKEYLLKNGLQYDNYLFIDDDIWISPKEIETLFETANKYKLQFFHPSISSKNYNHDPSACSLMYRNPNWLLSRQDWTEISCIGMNRQTLGIILDSLDINQTGYGLPQVWQSYFKEPCFNVVHDVEVVVTRPMGANGSLQDKVGQELIKKEFFETMDKVPKRDYVGISQAIPKRPQLSVFVIYSLNDEDFLKDCIDSIPNYAQRVIVRTLPIDYAKQDENGYLPKEYEPIIRSQSDMFINADLYYSDIENVIDFDKAKNAARNLCTGEWCFNLDADERIILNQWSEIKRIMDEVPLEYFGVYVTQNNIMLSIQDEKTKLGMRNPAPVCRMFRNDRRIKYYGEIHETVEESIEKFSKILDSNIQLIHLGFQRDAKVLLEKSERNLRKLWRNPHLMRLQRYMDYLTNTTLFRHELIKKLELGK